jgi:hypothetical protein
MTTVSNPISRKPSDTRDTVPYLKLPTELHFSIFNQCDLLGKRSLIQTATYFFRNRDDFYKQAIERKLGATYTTSLADYQKKHKDEALSYQEAYERLERERPMPSYIRVNEQDQSIYFLKKLPPTISIRSCLLQRALCAGNDLLLNDLMKQGDVFTQPFLLEWAAYYGNQALFKKLKDHYGFPVTSRVLTAIAQAGSWEIFQACDLKHQDRDPTPIMLDTAIEKGHWAFVEKLIAHPLYGLKHTQRSITAAAKGGHQAFLEALIEQDPGQFTLDKDTLDASAESGQWSLFQSIAEKLEARDPAIVPDLQTLKQAIRSKRQPFVVKFMQRYPDLEPNAEMIGLAIIFAVSREEWEYTEWLLQQYPTLINPLSVLYEAAENGNQVFVKKLHKAYNLNLDLTALNKAASSNNESLVQWFLEQGLQPTLKTLNAVAGRGGSREMVIKLIDQYKIPPTSETVRLAAISGNWLLLKTLMTKYPFPLTPNILNVVAGCGDQKLFEELTAKNPQVQPDSGTLECAASSGNLSLFDYLVEIFGMKPTAGHLRCAVLSGNQRLINRLVKTHAVQPTQHLLDMAVQLNLDWSCIARLMESGSDLQLPQAVHNSPMALFVEQLRDRLRADSADSEVSVLSHRPLRPGG